VEDRALLGGAKVGLAGSANGWREVEVVVNVSGWDWVGSAAAGGGGLELELAAKLVLELDSRVGLLGKDRSIRLRREGVEDMERREGGRGGRV
jgi:hypothetical protein